MKPATLTDKRYTIELTQLESSHLAVYAEEQDILTIWGYVKGVWDGYRTSSGFGYVVKPEDDRPEVHEAIYTKLKTALDEQMASYYEELTSLPEKAREAAIVLELEGDHRLNLVTAFIAAGGADGRDVDEAMLEFMKRQRVGDASSLAAFDPILQAHAFEAGWDNTQIIASLMRFIEAGGPDAPDDWRYEVKRHIEAEVAKAALDAPTPKF